MPRQARTVRRHSVMTSRRLLRAAGLLVWAFAGIPAVTRIARDPSRITREDLAFWVGAFVVFGVAFFRSSRPGAPEGRAAIGPLLVQTLGALGMNFILCTGWE